MNKSFVVGPVLGSIIVTAGVALAAYRFARRPDSVDVLSATQLHKSVKTPRQECQDEQVTRIKAAKDTHQLAGTGIGAVVGGLLGHGIGGGNGKILATVAGAAAGGYAGNKIEQRVEQGTTYTTTEQRCVTAIDSRDIQVGYDVEYVLDGKRHTIHMDHDPGRTLPVKDGRVIIDS